MTQRALWAVIFVAALAFGCKSPEDDTEPAVVPKAYAFEGKADPKYAGRWVSTDGASTIELAKDGGLNISTTANSAGGKSTSHVGGQWLASGDNLLFQYAEKSGGTTVLKDSAKLTGDTLVLNQEGGHIKTTYRRK